MTDLYHCHCSETPMPSVQAKFHARSYSQSDRTQAGTALRSSSPGHCPLLETSRSYLCNSTPSLTQQRPTVRFPRGMAVDGLKPEHFSVPLCSRSRIWYLEGDLEESLLAFLGPFDCRFWDQPPFYPWESLVVKPGISRQTETGGYQSIQ